MNPITRVKEIYEPHISVLQNYYNQSFSFELLQGYIYGTLKGITVKRNQTRPIILYLHEARVLCPQNVSRVFTSTNSAS